MKEYKSRIADAVLRKKLEATGAVVIEGPKWCGKTTTAEQVASSVLCLDDPRNKEQNLTMAEISPQLLLEGGTPRLIDEWQLASKLWDAIRFEVDHRDGMGQFILTGSAVPADMKEITHSGTGRFTRLVMRPMSLYESGESTGEISLKELFEGNDRPIGRSFLSFERLAFVLCRGGWPKAIGAKDETALKQARDYYSEIIRSGILRADGVQKNAEKVKRLMRSYARSQGRQTPNTVLAKNASAHAKKAMDDETVASYLNALRKIFVVEDAPAWSPNLRSNTAIRTADARYFVDPSIAAASLGVVPADLFKDIETFDLLFEDLCVRDLRVYADALGGKLYHYRDKTGRECDAIIQLRNGNYGLIEINLGGSTQIEKGAKSLLALKDKLDTSKMKNPSFLMVLTGVGEYAYPRKDGVFVVPIGCLKD